MGQDASAPARTPDTAVAAADPGSVDWTSPVSIAAAIRRSEPGRVVNQLVKTYKAEFALALGLMGARVPYSATAIAVWALLKQLAHFHKRRKQLAQRIARLDASMTILQVQFSVYKAYMAPEARKQRGLRPDCETGCGIPAPSVLDFWNKVLLRLSHEGHMKTITPSYFDVKLSRAAEMVAQELAQLQAMFTLQRMFDTHEASPPSDPAGQDALRRWRSAVTQRQPLYTRAKQPRAEVAMAAQA